jgi:excisionase family DNA binding protein
MTAGKIPSEQEVLFSIELLTIHQVATWARVSTKTICRWIESGKIPVVKFGERTYRIPASAVIKQLKQARYSGLIRWPIFRCSYFNCIKVSFTRTGFPFCE